MKQTEIGLIPDDWEVKRLGNVAFLKSGKTIDFSATKEGIYPCYGGNGIRAYIPFYSHDGAFPIIGRQGELCGNVQYADGKFYATEHAIVCTPNNNVDSKWLYFQLIKADINKYKTGNAQPGISVDKINSEVFIPFPPIAEQQRIAKALSDVDALISTTEKLIQKKKNIKQGAMQNLLTGKKRLPGFGPQTKSPTYKQTELGPIPEDWEVKSLGELCDLINGDRSSKYPKDDEMVSNGIPFINAGHLKEGAVDFDEMDYITRNHYQILSGAKIREGDILFCLRGSLGKNALVDFNDGAPASSLCVIRHKTINEELLFQIINSALFEKQIIDANSGSSQPNLSAKEVSNFLIPIPTSKEEQTAIANVLSSMDNEIETLNTKLEKYRNLKTAMMQQLLTGKIRLV